MTTNTQIFTSRGFRIVEKKNPLAVHGYFDTKERAENHLLNVIPEYVKKSYFMDKTLKANSFKIQLTPILLR